jgi:hypothetical protein
VNDSIQAILSMPGRHEVSAYGYPHTQYMVVEVTQDGTCYQLNKANGRDGVLSPDRWSEDATVLKDGRPLYFLRIHTNPDKWMACFLDHMWDGGWFTYQPQP